MNWEHKTVVIETGSFMTRGKIDVTEIDNKIALMGSSGFELVSAIPVSDGSVGTKRIVLFFKRERGEN